MKDVEVEISSSERNAEIIRGVRKRIALVFQSSARLRQKHSHTHNSSLVHQSSESGPVIEEVGVNQSKKEEVLFPLCLYLSPFSLPTSDHVYR
jgi:hypothetical protein